MRGVEQLFFRMYNVVVSSTPMVLSCLIDADTEASHEC